MRDFSNKMNATFEFFKQNFKSLIRTLLFLVGPPSLILSLLFGSILGDYMRAVFGMMGGGAEFAEFFTPNFFLKLIIIVIVGTISSVVFMSAVINYVILYREKQSNNIEVEEVWSRVKKTFGMYLGTMIGWFVLAIVAYIVMIIPFALLGAGSTGIAFILILACIILYFYLLVANSLVFVIRGFEPVGFFESFGRSMYLIRGKWWSTFGLFFIFYLITIVISYAAFIPWMMIKNISSLHTVEQAREATNDVDWFAMLTMGIQYIISYMIGSLLLIALIFQYFNLVERKESKGLMDKMGSLGTGENPGSNRSTEHY